MTITLLFVLCGVSKRGEKNHFSN